jgi:hypothetical protein
VIIRAGEFSVDPGVKWAEMPGLNGVNGVEGWLRMPSKPTIEFTIAQGQIDAASLSDFSNAQAKMIMIQLGTAATKAVLIHAPKARFIEGPTEKALGNETGLHLKAVCDDNYTASNEPVSSAITITTF